ncbi:MAG TPA: hypothetical protein VFS39_06490 [Nitrospira sp.]|nr:hypothetical protein [Nitrospira sp.]
MTIVRLLLCLLVIVVQDVSAGEPGSLGADEHDFASLEEATRVLAEEVKLASHPQTYLLVDLVAGTIVMKARGIELQRLPFSSWSAESRERMTGTFRLLERPSVQRPKLTPSSSEHPPITLDDMPNHYHLLFSPPLGIDVIPPMGDAPLQWVLMQAKTVARYLRSSLSISGAADPPPPHLVLTLSEDRAQSLAWSLVDGMPVIIRRPSR